MLYLVIECFRDGEAAPVYARFREKGRLLPDGLVFHQSWLSAELDRCFQIMETDDVTLFDTWTSQWDDLVDFEIIPVVGGGDAAATIRKVSQAVAVSERQNGEANLWLYERCRDLCRQQGLSFASNS